MSLFRNRSTVNAARWATIYVAFVAALCFGPAEAQENRYVEHGFSFQPPPGWEENRDLGDPEIRVQYTGPEREDQTQPKFNLLVHNYAINLSEEQINGLGNEMLDQLKELKMKEAQVAARQKTTVAGFDALQMDLSYNDNKVPMRLRQVYIPVGEHKRTYLFTFVDGAQHFDQTVAAAQSSINSFSPIIIKPTGAIERLGERPGAGSEMGAPKWLLILVGLLALAIVVGAAYLLSRRRTAI